VARPNADAVLKALAEPNRRAILELVRDGPRSMGDIADNFRITPQAVSQHLKVLKDAGLVREERQGRRHLFAVRPEGFEGVQEFLERFWAPHLNKLKNVAEGESKRRRRD
jgi:DNA-binding transcriptional ArsR family regulator